jgi:uncharacterized membrane protein
MPNRIARFFVIWFIMGMCYAQAELFVRGFTYLPMTFIGGFAGACIGLIDSHPSAPGLKMWQQCLLGCMIVLDTEFVSGLICNVGLGMALWDYSKYTCNLDGQICLRFAAVWFFIVPAASWLDDFIRSRLFGEQDPGRMADGYIRLLTLR